MKCWTAAPPDEAEPLRHQEAVHVLQKELEEGGVWDQRVPPGLVHKVLAQELRQVLTPHPPTPRPPNPRKYVALFFPYPEVVLLRKFFSPLHTLTPHTQSHIHYEYPFQGSLWSLLILSSGLCCVCGWVDSFEAPRSKSARGEAFGVPPLLHLLFWPGCWSHALTPPPPFTPTTHTGTAPGQLGETRGTGKHDAWLGEEGWGTGEDDDASPSGYAFR